MSAESSHEPDRTIEVDWPRAPAVETMAPHVLPAPCKLKLILSACPDPTIAVLVPRSSNPGNPQNFARSWWVCDNRSFDPGPGMSTTDYRERVENARVYDVADETPLEFAKNLSARFKNRIWLKREDLQPVFSFKLRGAYNKIASLSDSELGQGVICASAGNHAQGVALAAQRRGVRAVIVMPVTTPTIKIDAVRSLGGEVVLRGDAYDDAYAHARELAASEGLSFIHPFDDPVVIAGQGTIGAEDPQAIDREDRRYLRAHRRWRPDRRDRELRQGHAARHSNHRRGTRGLRRDEGIRRSGKPRHSRSRRYLCRWSRGATRRGRDVPLVPRVR